MTQLRRPESSSAFSWTSKAPSPSRFPARTCKFPSGSAAHTPPLYLCRDQRPAVELVLSEADYMRMQQSSHVQEAARSYRLLDSTIVSSARAWFDPNSSDTSMLPSPSARARDRDSAGIRIPRAFIPRRTESSAVARERALGQRESGRRESDSSTITRTVAHSLRDHAPPPIGAGQYDRWRPGRNWVSGVASDILVSATTPAFIDQPNGAQLGCSQPPCTAPVAERRRSSGTVPWQETLQLALWLSRWRPGTSSRTG